MWDNSNVVCLLGSRRKFLGRLIKQIFLLKVVALRLPLQENRIVAWKFCHVLHIILREGHYNCLEQSQRHTGMIEDLGKLWVCTYPTSILYHTDFLLDMLETIDNNIDSTNRRNVYFLIIIIYVLLYLYFNLTNDSDICYCSPFQ